MHNDHDGSRGQEARKHGDVEASAHFLAAYDDVSPSGRNPEAPQERTELTPDATSPLHPEQHLLRNCGAVQRRLRVGANREKLGGAPQAGESASQAHYQPCRTAFRKQRQDKECGRCEGP
jgi:hypothetical protein